MGLSPGDQGSPGEEQVGCSQRKESKETYWGAEPQPQRPIPGKEGDSWGAMPQVGQAVKRSNSRTQLPLPLPHALGSLSVPWIRLLKKGE